jgi:hypothetical protein
MNRKSERKYVIQALEKAILFGYQNVRGLTAIHREKRNA